MSEENKELVQMTATELQAQEALLTGGFDGFEDTDQEMLNTPFLKLAQSNTPQCDETNSGHIEDLKPGMFFNTQTGKVYGREVRVIPLYAKASYLHYGEDLGNFKGEYAKEEFDKLMARGVLRLAEDGFRVVDSEKGKCFYAITFYLFLPDFPEDGILPFVAKSKTLKHAKNWNSLSIGMSIKVGDKSRPAARFQIVWKLKSCKDENETGTWYNIGNKSGSGIEHVGNIFQPEFTKILPPLANAVKVMETMREQKLNYAIAQDAAGDEEIPDDSKPNPFLDQK